MTSRHSWSGEAVKLVANSGIGPLGLTAAEAAARRTTVRDPPQSAPAELPPDHLPQVLHCRGAELLQAATRGMTTELARTIANGGMAHALLEVDCHIST